MPQLTEEEIIDDIRLLVADVLAALAMKSYTRNLVLKLLSEHLIQLVAMLDEPEES